MACIKPPQNVTPASTPSGPTRANQQTHSILGDKLSSEARRYPEPTRKNGQYSRSKDGTIDYFVGPDGDITAERPHVHVIHDEVGDEVRLVVTREDGSHGESPTSLPGDASGNEVNAEIARLIEEL